MTQTVAVTSAGEEVAVGLTGVQTLLIAIASGALAANLYYAQPLVDLIGPSVGLGKAAEGLIVTASQIGYAVGLIFLVPLGDFFESRRLIATTMATNIVALAVMVATSGSWAFFAAIFAVGATSTAAQLLVPLAASLTPPERRGAVVGRVMSGLLGGILLARPVGSFLAEFVGWRGVFMLSGVFIALLTLALLKVLPRHPPHARSSYGALIRSLGTLMANEPVLRRRTFYHSMMFAAFSLFWTGAPLLLLSNVYNFTQGDVAVFALAGALGVLAAPVAGHLADRGHTRIGTIAALATAIIAFVSAYFGNLSLAALVVAAVLIDLGVQGNMVISQREIFALHPSIRNRLNSVYMATFFMGGALGSALTSPTLHYFGWHAFAILGIAFPVISLSAFLVLEGRAKA